MSPFFLISAATLHKRCALSCNSQFVLVFSWFRKLANAFVRSATADSTGTNPTGNELPLATTSHPVVVAVALHPSDHASLQEASRTVGLDEAAFCALAIHRASRSVIDDEPLCKSI
jgi:hypothetical protein